MAYQAWLFFILDLFILEREWNIITALKQITQERNLLSRTNRAASLHLQQKLEMEVLPLSKAEKIYSY